MTPAIDSISEDIQRRLADLSEEDLRLFLDDKAAYIQRHIDDSPLLDQLCWVRLIQTRLAGAFSKVLSNYKERLEGRTSMVGGWRKSPTTKAPSEFESPMPWLHPYKLAGEALQPLTEALETAVSSGETAALDLKLLEDVCNRYDIQLPLSPLPLKPSFPPRPLRMYQ